MVETDRHSRILQASLWAIEHGLFRVTYRIRRADAGPMPVYQLASSAAEAKHQIEAAARASGYTTVRWQPLP